MEKLTTILDWCNLQFGDQFDRWMYNGYYQELKYWIWNNSSIVVFHALSYNSDNTLSPSAFKFIFRYEEDVVLFKLRWLYEIS